MHRGPINLSTVTTRDPAQVINEVQAILEELNVSHKKTGVYNIRCEFKDLKFAIEINSIEKYSNIYLLKFYKHNQSLTDYHPICKSLFEKLTL